MTPQQDALATLRGGYSPQLMRAAAVLRMSAAGLWQFLSQHPNPCLHTHARNHNLPPPEEEDIRTRLHADCREMLLPAHLRELVAWLVECVDDDGFLYLPEEAEALPAPPAEMAEGIRWLQKIAPPGVAARTAQERILLLLRTRPPSAVRARAETLIARHWQWVQRKRWDKLPQRGLMPALQLLESLPPAQVPAPVAAPSLPDVLFSRVGGLWRAQAAAGALLRAQVTRAADATAQEWREAREIASAVAARRRWLLLAAQYAADRQAAFFSEGAAALRPLPMQAAAAEMNISPAMLSHIVCGKRGISPQGEFPLKCLYGSHTGSAVIQHHIRQLVAEEPPHKPLSDASLCRALALRGVHLARRTAAKHRRLAGFAGAAMRKRATPRPGAAGENGGGGNAHRREVHTVFHPHERKGSHHAD